MSKSTCPTRINISIRRRSSLHPVASASQCTSHGPSLLHDEATMFADQLIVRVSTGDTPVRRHISIPHQQAGMTLVNTELRINRPVAVQHNRTIKLTLHSHANAHCIMKVLKGRLTETRFATPTDKDREDHRPMTKIRETTYSENQVTYMADTLGVHRISNPDPADYAVSLHRKFTALDHDTVTSTNQSQCIHHPMRPKKDATSSTKRLPVWCITVVVTSIPNTASW